LWSLWSRPPLIGEDSPMTSPARSSDDRALLLSTWTSAGFAVVAVAWGLLTGSQLIVFDGLYSFASVALSLMAVLALRTARRGPDERYPWGREVWEPLTVVVKAAALGGLSVYALVGGVGDVLAAARGGGRAGGRVRRRGDLVGVVVTVVLRRRRPRRRVGPGAGGGREWTGDTLLSVGVLAGFIVAAVLLQAGRADLARYVDPSWSSWSRRRSSPSPPADDQRLPRGADHGRTAGRAGAGHGAGADTRRGARFRRCVARTSKVGGRLDLDVVFLVGADTTVRQCDAVRAELERGSPPRGTTCRCPWGSPATGRVRRR
jgi:hypothetical protein